MHKLNYELVISAIPPHEDVQPEPLSGFGEGRGPKEAPQKESKEEHKEAPKHEGLGAKAVEPDLDLRIVYLDSATRQDRTDRFRTSILQWTRVGPAVFGSNAEGSPLPVSPGLVSTPAPGAGGCAAVAP